MSAAPKHTGQFLGNPYDWRRPTRRRLAAQKRARDARRVLVPKAFGWGYTINFAALRRRITAAPAPLPRRSRPGSRRRPSRRVPRSSL